MQAYLMSFPRTIKDGCRIVEMSHNIGYPLNAIGGNKGLVLDKEIYCITGQPVEELLQLMSKTAKQLFKNNFYTNFSTPHLTYYLGSRLVL